MIELRTLGTVDVRAPGVTLQSVIHRPKHVALLAYLAVATPRGYQRRDELVALLWPDLGAERARAALRKVLHGLRQSLGTGTVVSRGDEEIGLAPGNVWCDVVAFEEYLEEGDPEAALAAYGGPLLPGLHVDGAPGFERWVERERARLRRDAVRAAWSAVDRAEMAGEPERALARAREAVELADVDDIGMRRLLDLHERLGDPAGAMLSFETYRARLEAELDLAPGAETVRAADRIRSRLARAPVAEGGPESATGEGGPEVAAAEGGPEVATPRPRQIEEPGKVEASAAAPHAFPGPDRAAPYARVRLRARAAAVVVIAALFGAYALWRTVPPAGAGERAVIAVGAVRDLTGESTHGAEALGDLLATNLARAPGLGVVSTARMYELLGRSEGDRPGEIATAARDAGATELLEGALHRAGNGALRLDLRRVDLTSGAVRAAVSVEGPALLDLVDRATARLVEAFGGGASDLRIADVTTRSVTALSAYQQGLRAFYRGGDEAVSHAFFTAALEEDSTFAMAAYYAARSAGNGADLKAQLTHALRLAQSATERERLLISASWAENMNRPERLAIAETLSVRYPAEPDGHYFLGRALLWSGDFMGAVPHLQRVVTMDRAALTGERARCRGCDALGQLITAYMMADSLAAAERTALYWAQAVPSSAGAQDALANVMEAMGRPEDALRARRRQAELAPSSEYPHVYPAVLAIRAGDFERADALLDAQRRDGTRAIASSARWYGLISLRYQGRFEEAAALAREIEGERPGALRALVSREAGRWKESAEIYASLAARIAPAGAEGDAMAARNLAWHLTRQATALASGGDTARLVELAGRIREVGRLSAYGRDRRLHHHVLGLWLAARGQHEDAVGEFRQAVFSKTAGYTRTNLEMARSLLALDRPEEAIAILRPAFPQRGLPGLHALRHAPELRSLLGAAFLRTGRPDSAAVHLRWAERAWRGADPVLDERLAEVRRLLGRTTGRLAVSRSPAPNH